MRGTKPQLTKIFAITGLNVEAIGSKTLISFGSGQVNKKISCYKNIDEQTWLYMIM